MTKQVYDLFIIGGGVNGCGIAADAAGRKLSVALCEQDDLASHTSSSSSKLIHGGLRYLEYYEFRLVREALIERDVLLKVAPQLVHPLRFIMPHNEFLRPAWMIRLGLFLYDHLNIKQSLPKSKALRLSDHPNNPLKPKYKKAFEYSDARVDDARLVVANALQAKANGAAILTRHKVISASQEQDCWLIKVMDQHNQEKSFYAKALINASGPWVDKIIQDFSLETRHHVRLVKGSHIVAPKIYEGDQAYILQNSDNRVIFVIPYQNQFSLIGTTDIDYQGDPSQLSCSPEEQDYLCNAVNAYFQYSISPKQIIWSYAGVRPLQSDMHGDPKKVTRDYSLEVHDKEGKLPVLSIFGGKVTTYRKLAEHALEQLQLYFPKMGKAWTAYSPLPGGDCGNFNAFCSQLEKAYPWLPKDLVNRLANAYGSRCHELLKHAQSLQDLGLHFGAGLYEKEVRFMIETEWARTLDDIIWRRSKLGLFLSPQEKDKLNNWLNQQPIKE
ncbi:MAG: glycerol-3-phosphate dehydrogenase [Gammaproteobacteria bacterium]|jgi:glycerol-3-phosphate dehydrogenase|nr:glycerol-3-phosphate dehydrogenase [Gammaproteobacteria bacterium]